MVVLAAWKRRNLALVAAAILVLTILLYSQPVVDANRFKNVIPSHDSGTTSKPESDPKSAADVDDYYSDAGLQNGLEEEHGSSENDQEASGPVTSVRPSGERQLHYLIPASDTNVKLCYMLVSSWVNRYPVPMLLGWHGEGEFSASVTHLAKLRAIQRYLHSCKEHEDDDLVMIIDGYDVIMQMPPEVMLERYMDIRDAADKRLADQFGITVEEAHKQNLRQTIFWGPDKICWPTNWNEPRCWAVPRSNLPPKAFGPKTGNGNMLLADPRWLNSGTVIGPIADMRKYIDVTMDEIEATYDEKFVNSESDQFYLANVWGRQEYYRSLKASKDGKVEGADGKRIIPKKLHEDQETELHIAIEYESSLFQTKAGYEPFFGYMQFNQSGFKAEMKKDMFDQGKDFKPYDIEMPANVLAAMSKLYNSVPEEHKGVSANDWLSTVNLGVNFVTKHIYGLWHCTASKDPIHDEYPRLWFYPFAKALIKSAIKASHDGEHMTAQEIDGHTWKAKTVFPDKDTLTDELGGAWSDHEGEEFVPFNDICGDYVDKLFGGQGTFKGPPQ